jgi:acetyl esterase/lipase
MVTEEALRDAASLYIGERDATHPLISPIYADLSGLPPMLIHAGDHEVLLSDSTRLAERGVAAGVNVELEVWPEMWHVWHFAAATVDSARQAVDGIGAFIAEKTGASRDEIPLQ